MIKRHEITQNSTEWFELRKGKFTASTTRDLFMKPTTATYQKALYRVVLELLTGESPESFQNEHMIRGSEMESVAREQYERDTFNSVEDGGFFQNGEFFGASPDGLVDDDGLLEIKCPAFNTQIDYLIKQKLPTQYYWQIHSQLYATGREWVDFYSFYPKLKPLLIRTHRDESIIKELESKLTESIEEVERIIKLIK